MKSVRLLRQFIREEFSKLGIKNKQIQLNNDDPIVDEIEPELVNILKKSYEKLGGHPKIKQKGDLKHSYDTWVVADVDDDPEPDVAIFGSKKSKNIKMGAVATDGGITAKDFLMKMNKNVLQNGWWGEVSGPLANLVINKLKLSTIDDQEKVEELLKGKTIKWYGKHPEGKFPHTNGWYERNINGTPQVKIIVGDIG